MKIVLYGYGKLNKLVHKIIQSTNNEIVAIIDFKSSSELKMKSIYDVNVDYDVIIDFSNVERIDNLLDYIEINNKPTVIATTNLTENQLSKINILSKSTPIFQSYNTSYGVYALTKIVEDASKLLDKDYDISLIDIHHKEKKDAPSGTAKLLADAINKSGIQISSQRVGDIVGTHEISFTNNYEQITIKHSALNREIFADGALKAAMKLVEKENGLYNLQNLYEEQ